MSFLGPALPLRLLHAPPLLGRLVLAKAGVGGIDDLLLGRQRPDIAGAAPRVLQEPGAMLGCEECSQAAIEVLADPAFDERHDPFPLVERRRAIGPLEDALRRLTQPRRPVLRRADVPLSTRDLAAPPRLFPSPLLLPTLRLLRALERGDELGHGRVFPTFPPPPPQVPARPPRESSRARLWNDSAPVSVRWNSSKVNRSPNAPAAAT